MCRSFQASPNLRNKRSFEDLKLIVEKTKPRFDQKRLKMDVAIKERVERENKILNQVRLNKEEQRKKFKNQLKVWKQKDKEKAKLVNSFRQSMYDDVHKRQILVKLRFEDQFENKQRADKLIKEQKNHLIDRLNQKSSRAEEK